MRGLQNDMTDMMTNRYMHVNGMLTERLCRAAHRR